MADWTEETWTFDSVSLNNYAYGVTVADDGGIPQKRGSNRQISYRHGSQFRRKFYDSRVVTLSMFAQDRDTADAIPATDQLSREQLNDNIEVLKALFGETREEGTLVHKIRTSTGLESRTATAEVSNLRSFDRNQDGLHVVRFSVDFFLSDPFFYGDAAGQQSISAKNTPTVITNGGHVDATELTIVITGGSGGAVNPVLANTDKTIQFTYIGTIANTDTVTFDIGAGTATHSDASDDTIQVTHAGDRAWMLLSPGNNTLELTMDSGAGSVTVDYSPPYF